MQPFQKSLPKPPGIGARSIAPREFENDRAEQCSALRFSHAFAGTQSAIGGERSSAYFAFRDERPASGSSNRR